MVLLDGGDDPNEVDEKGRHALHMAAWKGCRPALFQRVVARIHDVNTVTNNGSTALMFAAWNNHPAIVSQLLSDDKIDASLKDNHNKTALKRAIDWGHAECVTILRQHGAPE
jgi:ankyrin repeat protein